MRIIIILLSFTFFHCAIAQKNENTMIKLTDLEGKWFIHQTNFPMWLKGDKSSPTFQYTLDEDKKGAFLHDKVSYFKNEKVKTIEGIDRSTNSDNTAFVWRGKGILKILKSKWQILYINTADQWAIIYFEKTLFTPKGYDVISKFKSYSTKMEIEVKAKLKALEIDEKLTFISQKNE